MYEIKEQLKNLKLPDICVSDGKEYFLDPVRDKMILKTPEEEIRQEIIQFLLKVIHVPSNMLQVEMLLSKYGVDSIRRADLVIDRYTKSKDVISPLAIVECKAPEIMLGDAEIQQVCDYADCLGADYIAVTNGIDMIVARYSEERNQYIELKSFPEYETMLKGEGDVLLVEPPKPRFSYDELENNRDYYCGYEFNPDTPVSMRSFLTNLWECFLDTSHSLPEREYKIFTLLKDYGIRMLSCGNASGGTYQGAYRSFLIKYHEKTFFMNLSFFDYGTSTILTVSVDQDNHRPHNALQYSVDKSIVRIGEAYHFYHNGRITVGKIGSGKSAELKELLENLYPVIIKNGKIELGTVHNSELLYMDTPEIMILVENLLSYALIRDEYREICKRKREFDK